MNLIKHVPIVPLQQAVYGLLANGQNVPVHGTVPAKAPLPYITIDAVTAKPVDVKNMVQWNCSLTINVWGTLESKQNVYETVNDIVYLVTKYGISKVTVDGFDVMDAVIDLVEVFPEQTTGYHGTVTLLYQLVNNGEE